MRALRLDNLVGRCTVIKTKRLKLSTDGGQRHARASRWKKQRFGGLSRCWPDV